MAMGALSQKSRATSWSQPQSEPLTVSVKCTSGESPWPMAQLPSAACMPPWAAEEWERRAGTRERQMTSKPAPAASMAARSPARPAPMHKKSVMKVSIMAAPYCCVTRVMKRKRSRVRRPMATNTRVRPFSKRFIFERSRRLMKPHLTPMRKNPMPTCSSTMGSRNR